MPSKFVAKAFVRDEITKSAKTKQEIIATLEQKLQLSRETELRPDNAAQGIAALQSEILTIKRTLGQHDSKLAMLVEGSVRRHVVLEKGDDWANERSVNSLTSLVEYVRVCAKQDAVWSTRATGTLLGLVKEGVGFPLTWIRFDILTSFTGSVGESRQTD